MYLCNSVFIAMHHCHLVIELMLATNEERHLRVRFAPSFRSTSDSDTV